MKKAIVTLVLVWTMLGVSVAFSQVKMTKEQMMFYTSDWKGDRFPDGRPKVPDDLLKRAVDCIHRGCLGVSARARLRTINLRETGKPSISRNRSPAARSRRNTCRRVRIWPRQLRRKGKAEGRVSGNNSWPINELQIGDVYVADGFGKIVEGTLIGSNLGNGIAAHTHTGFVFYGGIRDQEENREIPNFNGFYKGYDPSAWAADGADCD